MGLDSTDYTTSIAAVTYIRQSNPDNAAQPSSLPVQQIIPPPTSNNQVPSPPTLARLTGVTTPRATRTFDLNRPNEFETAVKQGITNPSHLYVLCTNEKLSFLQMLSPKNTGQHINNNIYHDAQEYSNRWWIDLDMNLLFRTYGTQHTHLYSQLAQKFKDARGKGRKSRELKILALQIFFLRIQSRLTVRPELWLPGDVRKSIVGIDLISDIGKDYAQEQLKKMKVANGSATATSSSNGLD